VEALAEEVLVEADPQADGDFIYYLFNYYLPFITFFFINQSTNQQLRIK
jgi:hypothetical protein